MITALNNGRIKKIVQLRQKAKIRKETGVFLAEGRKMFLEAPLSKLREVYVSESFLKGLEEPPVKQQKQDRQTETSKFTETGMTAEKEMLRRKLQECSCETVSDEVFRKISDTQTPQGILCVLDQFHYDLEDLLSSAAVQLWLVLEDLQDPGNLGTIVRSGEGAGITGVILNNTSVDIYNPKTIRATMGSIYRVPFLYINDLASAVGRLKQAGIFVYAAQLQESRDYDALNFTGGTAFLIGNEGSGLRPETLRLADAYLKIPMQGQVESLNASVAASILMYEAARQRRKK